MVPTIVTLSTLLLAVGSRSGSAQKTVICHMTNTKGSVKWAIDQGANGVHLDLQFTKQGYPTEFKHGGLCDCSCSCLTGCTDYGVCSALWAEMGSHCGAATPAEELTQYIGSAPALHNTLALIYVTGRLDSSMTNFYNAGQNAVQLLNRNVFQKGYKGHVILDGMHSKYIDFLKGALDAVNSSSFRDQYYYTIGGDGDDYVGVWNNLLTLGTKNLFYSTGITNCITQNFREAISGSKAQNGYAGLGIWTVDTQSAMEDYIASGVTSIMTNFPARAVDVFGADQLAVPGQALKPVGRDLPFKTMRTCDCGYRNEKLFKLWGGGCILTRVPPSGSACKCSFRVPYSCDGTVVECSDGSSESCKNPREDKVTCQQGNGDCDGY